MAPRQRHNHFEDHWQQTVRGKNIADSPTIPGGASGTLRKGPDFCLNRTLPPEATNLRSESQIEEDYFGENFPLIRLKCFLP